GWPGNVRELKNVVERSVHRATDNEPVDEIVFDPFASAYRPPVETTRESAPTGAETTHPAVPLELPCDLKEEVARLEKAWAERALAEARFSQTDAAPLLGLTYHQLRALLRKHG